MKKQRNRLEMFRSRAGMTQQAVAERVGVTQQYIAAIEKGYFVPTVFLALKLAMVLEEKIEDLFVLGEKEVNDVKEKMVYGVFDLIENQVSIDGNNPFLAPTCIIAGQVVNSQTGEVIRSLD